MDRNHGPACSGTGGRHGPEYAFDASGASFLPLGCREGNSHISCLHLEIGGKIEAPSITHAAALLCVHGCSTVTTPFARINIHAGSGCVFDKNEPYSLTSDSGAILLIVESDHLETHERAISTPQRIAGQQWPGDRAGSMA
jgi:hypothetical protein